MSPESTSPVVSIVVLAYRQVRRLDAVLTQLRTHETVCAFEVIVVANGVDSEVSAVIDAHSHAIRVDSRVNRGFGGGCNLGASQATGEYLVFLNDDARIRPGWLDALVSVMNRHDRVGALASVLVDGADVVLEAGGAINHRGDVWPPDRGRPLRSIQGRGPRQAGYATGGSLLVRSDVFADVGGFDLAYHPAYFEDADLSCRIWAEGHEVWTTTASVVEHSESASTTSAVKRALQLRNGNIFRGRWTSEFNHRGIPELAVGDELPLPSCRRVLFIDDRAPAPGVGSGAGRARQNMLAIASGGCDVLFHPREPAAVLDAELIMAGVELVQDLSAVVAGSVEAVVVSRPHNHDLWDHLRGQHPDAMFVYDAEARFSARMEKQLELDLTDAEAEIVQADLETMLELETTIVSKADAVVTISIEEKPWFEQLASGEVHWIDPMPDRVEPPVAVRDQSRAVFVAGWEAGEFSPNGDALKWFATEVLPLVEAAGVDVQVDVTGGGVPASLRELESEHLRFVGRVDDLDALHSGARLAIAPTRYGAGVKLKVVDALRNATPVVATSVGAEGIEAKWRDHMAVDDDAAGFAAAMVRLLRDDEAWAEVHAALVEAAMCHRSDAVGSWRRVLGLEMSVESTEPETATVRPAKDG